VNTPWLSSAGVYLPAGTLAPATGFRVSPTPRLAGPYHGILDEAEATSGDRDEQIEADPGRVLTTRSSWRRRSASLLSRLPPRFMERDPQGPPTGACPVLRRHVAWAARRF